MKKKLVACMLVAAMALSLAACGDKDTGGGSGSSDKVSGETEEKVIDGITYNVATDLTKDEITLTYFHFDQEETVKLLAERFEELYPNITVDPIYTGTDTYGDTLLALIQNGQAPDVAMYLDADYALSNMLLMDITDYYDNDPETKELASTINDAGQGMFGTSRRFAVPVKFFPGVMYADLNCLEKLNIDAPDVHWTWSDMVSIIEKATTDIGDGLNYYGLGFYNRLDSLYGIASSQDIVGEFGFNGETFDLSAWAIGEQEFSNMKLSGKIAPIQNSAEMEAWTGTWEDWCGSTGHVALFSEAFWTFQNIWNTETYKTEYDLDIIPLPVPAVSEEDASNDHHTIATIDFGGVVDGCKYPREAYELLKFMSFGRDGWLTRCQIYSNEENLSADGVPLKATSMPAPITTNEEVWDAYIEMYCDGMDETHTQYWKDYFASCMMPISYGWESIAGYWNYCAGYFNSIGIHDLVDSGKKQAADYVDEGTTQANIYHAQAMLDYFGPDGYDVLTDEEYAKYEKILEENTVE